MSETLDIFRDYAPPLTDRFGSTYVHTFDFDRLNAQASRVFHVMKDGKWRTLAEIAAVTGDPEASISARLRDLANIHGLKKERRRRGEETRGLFEYSIRVHQ